MFGVRKLNVAAELAYHIFISKTEISTYAIAVSWAENLALDEFRWSLNLLSILNFICSKGKVEKKKKKQFATLKLHLLIP